MNEAELAEAEVPEAEVPEAEVPEAELAEAELAEAELAEAELAEAELAEAEVPKAELAEAELPEDCCICMSPMQSETAQFVCLQCGAAYHFDCIQEWLDRGSGCPNCRFCIAAHILRKLIPDIPANIVDSMTSSERFVLCRLALYALVKRAHSADT
tara:strand:+ start:4174 stop:4641 length:468 start_codon:yes stop_codon:yes gene_type:complete